MPPLSPCPECRRHVRVDSRDCPFCGSSEPRPAPRRPKRRRERLGRAALFLAGALGASACAGTDEPVNQNARGDEVEEDPGMADIYGGPPAPEPESEEPAAEDSEESMAVEAYGAPAPPPDE